MIEKSEMIEKTEKGGDLSPALMQYLNEDVCDIRGFGRSVLVSARRGRFEMTVFPGEDCANNVGTVHGGFLLAVADIAASGACDTYGRECSSMTFSANFMRPCFASDASLQVVGTVLRYGKRSAVTEVTITRPNGEMAFKGTSTLAVFGPLINSGNLRRF